LREIFLEIPTDRARLMKTEPFFFEDLAKNFNVIYFIQAQSAVVTLRITFQWLMHFFIREAVFQSVFYWHV
jgi:hypothetical protein